MVSLLHSHTRCIMMERCRWLWKCKHAVVVCIVAVVEMFGQIVR